MQEDNAKEKIQKLLSTLTQQQKTVEPPKTFKGKCLYWFHKTVAYIAAKFRASVFYLDRFINFIVHTQDQDRNEILQYARPPILFGTYITIIFVVFGGVWAMLAPLDSATVARGTVISSSNKKIIQSIETATIKEIYVKTGDYVQEGQVLMELDDTRQKSKYEALLHQYRTYMATEARLIAERDNMEAIPFPEALLKENDNIEVQTIVKVQNNLFNSRRKVLEASIENIKKKGYHNNKIIEAEEYKKKSLQKNLEVTKERIIATKDLVNKGFSQKVQLLDFEIREASIRSEIAVADTTIARAQEDINKHDIEILHIQNQFIAEAMNELKNTQIHLSEARENLNSIKFVINEMVIKAPVEGVVDQLYYHTLGGVVAGGRDIMEITPTKDRLLIEAKIDPKNISNVAVGQHVKIRISAFKSRISPVFNGTLVSLSSGTVQDQSMMGRGEAKVYIGTIELDMEDFDKFARAKGVKLIAGMQAEVQIVTGTRTLVQYLLDPITDNMFRSFKEK